MANQTTPAIQVKDSNVGIGTTSPAYKLDVSGSLNVAANVYNYIGGNKAFGGNGSTFLYLYTGTTALSILNNADSSELVRITNDGNVGIGTTSPSQKLSVYGNIYLRGGDYITWSNGDAQIDSISYNLRFLTYDGVSALVERMRITSAGNVGIGTNSPAQKLHVVGNGLYTGNLDVGHSVSTEDAAINLGTGRTGNGFAYIDLIGDTTYTDYGLRILRNNGGANTTSLIVHRGTGDFSIQNNEAANLVFLTAATERMRISSTGNVGIGTNSPAALLNVGATGTLHFTEPGIGTMLLKGESGTARGMLEVHNGNSSSKVLLQAYTGGAGVGTLSNTTLDIVTNSTTRMVVTSAGNVGIGTTAPTYKLQVIGGQFGTYLKGGDLGSGSDILRLVNASDETTTLFRGDGNVSIGSALPLLTNAGRGNLTINGSSDAILTLGIANSHASWYYVNSTAAYLSTDGGRALIFETQSAARMFIASGGNVGIGTTSPGEKLVVSNAGAAGFEWVPSTGRWYRYNRSTSAYGGIYTEASEHTWSIGTSEKMRLSSDGNVGIGTTSPQSKLDIERDSRTGSHPTSLSLYVTGTMGTGNFGGQAGNIEFRHSNASQGIGFGYQAIYQTGDNPNEVLNILSKGTGALTLNAYAYSTGNVGIGTASPTEKLHVDGSVVVTYNNSYQGINSVGNKAILARVSPTTGIINYAEYATAANLNGFVMGSDDARVKGNIATDSLEFITNVSERMRITSAGNVGIGTSSPSNILHITNVMRMDNVSASSPNLSSTSAPKYGYGDVSNERYLAEPVIWLKINVGGTEYVIPGYTEVI